MKHNFSSITDPSQQKMSKKRTFFFHISVIRLGSPKALGQMLLN